MAINQWAKGFTLRLQSQIGETIIIQVLTRIHASPSLLLLQRYDMMHPLQFQHGLSIFVGKVHAFKAAVPENLVAGIGAIGMYILSESFVVGLNEGDEFGLHSPDLFLGSTPKWAIFVDNVNDHPIEWKEKDSVPFQFQQGKTANLFPIQVYRIFSHRKRLEGCVEGIS